MSDIDKIQEAFVKHLLPLLEKANVVDFSASEEPGGWYIECESEIYRPHSMPGYVLNKRNISKEE